MMKQIASLAALLLALTLSFSSPASAQTVVSSIDVPVQAQTIGGDFNVVLSMSNNSVTSGTITAASVASFQCTVTTAEPHGLSVGDDVVIEMVPASPIIPPDRGIDGGWVVNAVPSATQFRFTRQRATTAYTVAAGSRWYRPAAPAQSAFRVSWSDGTSGSILTFNEAISQTETTNAGAVGGLLVGPISTSGASSFVNITTESNLANSALNPNLVVLNFTVSPSATLGQFYSISITPIPVSGAYPVARYIQPLTDLGAGTLFEVPQLVELPATIDDSVLQNIEITGTSVHDWMMLD